MYGQVRGDDADDPATYLVTFGESQAHYMVCYLSSLVLLYLLVLKVWHLSLRGGNTLYEDFADTEYILMQPLPTKLILRKKRAREGKSSEEVEHFPVPSRLTVRKRSTVAAIELKEVGVCQLTFIFLLSFEKYQEHLADL